MATPKKGYWLYGVTERSGPDDVKLPSVTTITKRYQESGGLIHWAWKEGSEGRNYRESREAAAGAGTGTHAMIDAWASKEREPEVALADLGLPVDAEEKARTGFRAFMEWVEQTKLVILAHEHSMVSREHRFGGTPDALGCFETKDSEPGKIILLDWKTGGIYTDAVLQLAAYRQLLREDSTPGIEEAHLIRLDKEWATFSHRQFSSEQLDIAFAQFLDLRRCYEREPILKSMVK